MILRVVSGRIRPGELAGVTASFREGYVPLASTLGGLIRFVCGTRPDGDGGHRIALMTIWSDLEAASAVLGPDLGAVRTLDGSDHGALLDRVDYYELEEGRTKPAGTEPSLLRVTAGTVAKGLDADIQAAIRAQLGGLPPEALEAYVGRRVLGRDVEIAFVSTWSEAPAGTALDAPIWPAISERYDAFRMDLLEVFLSGSGRPATVPR